MVKEYFDIKSFLDKNHSYYQKLNATDKIRFINRVESFIDSKSITGRQGLSITPLISTQIAAAAVQVTFGLDTWDYSHFNQILIYPNEYKNPQTGKMHKGETNLGGFMCFSWKDFQLGNQTPDDKINLGLHEFGHALRFNGIQGAETDYFFENYFKRWLACAAKEYNKLRKGLPSIFRKYGGVNINEFFSVVIETFFEKPLEFKANCNDLYIQTSILLNQTFTIDGAIELNCRQKLLSQMQAKLSVDYSDALSYNLNYNTSKIMATVFFVIGAFSLSGEGYKYPPAYILFFIASLFWLHLERKYTRIYIGTNQFKIAKGYLIFKDSYTKTLPLSQLISFYVGYEYINDNGTTIKQISSTLVTYYQDGDFYEETLYISINQPKFDAMCHELINNNIHVFIKD